MKTTILVQKNTHGRVKFIELTLNGDAVDRVWGLIGSDKLQTTSNTYDYINKGKSNQLDPMRAASADYERIIDTKTKEGYLITDSLDNLPEFDNEVMNFDELPVQFCCSKPTSKISDKAANKLLASGNGKYFLKENGLCHYILIDSNREVKIYSRRNDDHTRKYEAVVKAVESMHLPAGTILATEFIIDPALNIPHMEAFKLMSSISRSDTLKGKVKDDITKTLKLQEKHPVKAVVFNVLFHNENLLTVLAYKDIVENFLSLFNTSVDLQNVLMPPRELTFDSHKEAVQWTEINLTQYEGLVLWDMSANAEITYNGKPKRRACWKVKAKCEDDVIAIGYNEGDGDKQGKIGSLNIGKLDSEGNFVQLAKCGSGLVDELCEPDRWEFPCVIEIKYDQRFPTGSYQFPRFSKFHEDKLPEDVVLDENGM